MMAKKREPGGELERVMWGTVAACADEIDKTANIIEKSCDGYVYDFTKERLRGMRDAVKILRATLPAIPDLAGKPESDGWIEWRGGECPVDPQAIVLIEMRRCGRSAGRAFTLEWSHRGKDGDIIAYRVAEQKETR